MAKALVHDFGLSAKDATAIMQEYNTRCRPQWTDAELQHKLSDAGRCDRAKRARGTLSQAQVGVRYSCFSRPPSRPQTIPSKILGYFPSKARRDEEDVKDEPPSVNEQQTWPAALPQADHTPFSRTPTDAKDDAEAKRIASELAKLHKDAAITGPDDKQATFYACLIRDFGATYIGRAS